MAKRKRLNPVQRPPETKEAAISPRPAVASTSTSQTPTTPRTMAPVAQVAGDAAGAGALQEMADYIARARADGLLLVSLPLAKILEDHMHRDRILPEGDDEEMEALVESLRARGQQVPLDVVKLTSHPGERYGLVSGMRRLLALRRLHAETGETRFARATARVVARQSAAEAYRAMVEENEIRADVGFYARARIALKTVEAGAWPDLRRALQGLYGNVPRAKRSKIGSFVPVVAALDGHLRHPNDISEKRGLALARGLEADAGLAPRLVAALEAAGERSAEEERAILEAGLRPAAPVSVAPEEPEQGGIALRRQGDRLVLSGPGVDADLEAALTGWLAERG